MGRSYLKGVMIVPFERVDRKFFFFFCLIHLYTESKTHCNKVDDL